MVPVYRYLHGVAVAAQELQIHVGEQRGAAVVQAQIADSDHSFSKLLFKSIPEYFIFYDSTALSPVQGGNPVDSTRFPAVPPL